MWWPSACRRFSTRLAIVDLPEPDRPVNHTQRGAWPLSARARGLVDVEVLPVDVAGAAQREVERAGGDGRVALAVDQDEAAELAIVAHSGSNAIGWSRLRLQ